MNIKKTFLYQFLRDTYLKLQVAINPEKEVDRCYYPHFNKHVNLKKPHNLIEKIYWMELHSDTSMWTLCADKYRVREYISNLGLLDYMPKLYGHWDKVNEIDFNQLPDSFVIKANNGCATVKVVPDKSKINLRALRKELKRWLILPYGWMHAQIHYTRIKPCILAEELLHNDYLELSPKSLVDFKVYCINGEPQFIWVAYNRVNMHVHVQCFDTNWNPKPEYARNSMSHYVYDKNDMVVNKPVCLDEMMDIARKISKQFPQVRTDFYVVNGRPVIGELTFTQGYGFLKEEVYDRMGEMIDLSKVKKQN